MSLTVTEDQIARARVGEMDEAEFIDIIRTSLPFAYDTVERLAKSVADGEDFALEAPAHMDDADRGQLLRLFASTSMRTAMERHFGLTLAFQNCHAAGGTKSGNEHNQRFQRFVSIEGQVLAQRPELRDC